MGVFINVFPSHPSALSEGFASPGSPQHTPQPAPRASTPPVQLFSQRPFFSKFLKNDYLLIVTVDSQPYEIGCRSKFVHHYTFSCCLVAQLCLTFYDHMDCRPPGSSVLGISQARTLEWVAISFSRGSS